jgi:hypothetical protein
LHVNKIRTHKAGITGALVAVMASAAAAMIVGAFNREDPAIYRLALGVALFACMGLLLTRTDLSESVLEIVRQDSYDDGYGDGCEVRRESVLSLAGSGVTVLPVDRSAQQLGQQGDIGGRA